MATFTAVSSPDFSLSSIPLQTVPAGQGVTVPITITVMNGFSSAVSFTWTNSSSWPAGLSASFMQNPAMTSTSISVATSPQLPAGSYTLQFSATGGGVTHTGGLTLAASGFDWEPWTDARLVALDTGEVYAYFAIWVASSDYGSWRTQIKNANVVAPGGNQPFGGPRNSIADGINATPASIRLPDFRFIDGGFGFGSYNLPFTAQYYWCCYQNQELLYQYAYPANLLPYPQPGLQSMSTTFGLPGTILPDITINGSGLGAVDATYNLYRGITSVNVTGTGLSVRSFTPANVPYGNNVPPTATSLKADINIDSNARPGTSDANGTPYTVTVTVFGYATNALPLTIGDLTPVITSIDQEALYAGGEATISIHGSNFGSAVGALTVCGQGAEPCSQSANITSVVVTFWSPTLVTARLTASPNASGHYDVQLASMGATGSGFLASPGGQTSSKSNRKPIAVSGAPNLTLRVTSNGTAVNSGDCVYIDATPVMPPVTATIMDQNNQPVSGTATWRVQVEFMETTRTPIAGGNYSPPFPVLRQAAFPTGPLQEMSASQPWNVPWTSVFGGDAILMWTYNGAAQTSFNFCIRARNPDLSTTESALNATPYWFAKNIAIHEDNMSQFCEQGRMQIAYCSNSANFGQPVFHPPAGYGIMAVDPAPNVDAIWNWTSAIAAGVAKLNALAGPPQYIDQNDTRAYPFWARQLREWELYNALQPPDKQVPPPSDRSEGPNCSFTASSTPITGQPGRYWFGDAILMKQNGGAPQNYISWDNRQPGQTPRWMINTANSSDENIVYEFCMCATVATCVR